jgi:anti-sigma regulatory factor (Ser/Thr protein kinase)
MAPVGAEAGPSVGAIGSCRGPDDERVSVSAVVPPTPASVGMARAVVGAVVDRTAPDWGDRVRLAVSELVTNAVVHAGTDIQVAATWDGRRLRVVVGDGDPSALPVDKLVSFDQIGGWGLGLVDRAVGGWTCEVADGGKVVWFEVDGSSVS